ncbi:transmembrane channel-like protein 7 isoform X2 [Parasteatoda tepidariorum]|uniref:transmembrane channel-like protein 7 isoform X2 n=1 Tax=Parasteatoda tepidariorum TaxID=114398 RepID=UPI001C726EAF|nr:transmembrane channel-like protein 7 [Parasteatoda tepidariorum]
MELQKLNQESHTIDFESSSDESHDKMLKKPSNVTFAPETSFINRISSRDSDDDIEDMTENDIKTEICSVLPSNTIGRKKYKTLNKTKTAKASTFPRKSDTNEQHDVDKPRPRSFVTKKPSFLSSLNLPSLQISQSFDGVDSFEEFGADLNDEEKKKELQNIRNFPIRMSEKKKYRNAILDTIPIHDRQDKSVWLQVNDMWASVQQSTTKFELWHATLKRIEGLHGTGVVSYFVFLRWLIFLNLILFITFLIFITLPHSIFSRVPLKKINYAPNNTFFLEKYNQYPDPRSTPKPLKRTDRLPFDFKNKELISDLGSLLNRYLTNDTIENINYDQRNYTDEQRRKLSEMCESRYKKEELSKSIDVLSGAQDLLQGTGWLQSTILFLGYYTPTQILFFGYPYNMPVAFLCVFFVSSIMCILMMVQYSSHGVQETVLARKSNYLAYSNILFCSWDYCIENKKSSIIRHRSILHEIKSTLAEERRRREVKGWSKSQKFKVHTSRFFLNAFVLAALCGSYYLIYKVVNFQLREMQSHRLQDSGVQTLLVQYLTPVCITSLNIFVPIIFNAIVKFESYNTQTQINIALIRIVFLRLSSVFVLVGLLFQQIVCEPKDDCKVGTLASCQSPICWETYVGQQLYKLAVTDFIVYIMLFLAYDLPRDLLVRSCPNKATQMVGRQVFDLPNQVLSLVYSQTLCWLGMVYSPLIPLITVIKFIILFYIKRVLVLKFCTPPPIPYKASRSNAMFIMILLLSFFSVLIIHGYSLSSLDPSPACSPFRYYSAMVDAIPITLYSESSSLASIVNLIFSGIVLFPAIILLCIAVYYYWTIVIAHRKMIKILKSQIVLEGRDKQFLLNRLTHAAKGHLD